jgi:hypothetical protein
VCVGLLAEGHCSKIATGTKREDKQITMIESAIARAPSMQSSTFSLFDIAALSNRGPQK